MSEQKWHRCEPGTFYKIGWGWPLPRNLGQTLPFLAIRFAFGPDAGYAGIESTRIFAITSVADEDGTTKDLVTYSTVIDIADGVEPLAPIPAFAANRNVLQLIIPNSRLTGKAAGSLSLNFQISSLSTGPVFQFGNPYMKPYHGPQPVGLASGFSITVS